MSCFLIYFFVLTLFSNVVVPYSTTTEDNECVVTEYEQVEKALETCNDIVISNVKVPAHKQLTLNFRNGTTLTFRGNITFEQAFWEGPLVHISGSNFAIKGEGSVLDGNGPLYWDGKGTWGSTLKPKFIKINAKNAIMDNIKLFNCPVVCVMIRGSENLTIRSWNIDILDGDEGVAPPNKYAHNTGGFSIGASTNNLLIENTVIYNQDDCVVITSGENITVRNIFCHGSHGLSINGEGEVLKNVLIENSIITNAENGIHVKTHVGSPPGLLQNVTYKDITILDSKYYGINIQQNYQSLPEGVPIDGPSDNSVKIVDLALINVSGNVQNGAVPVFILCAQDGCFDWSWTDVQMWGTKSNNCTGYSPKGFVC